MMDYTRGDDGGAPIDARLVQELIAARTSLRQAGNFKAADNVRADLQRMGVTIWDRDRVWMVGDSPPPRNIAGSPSRSGKLRPGRGGSEGRSVGGYRSDPAERARIFVEGLSQDTTWQTLKVDLPFGPATMRT